MRGVELLTSARAAWEQGALEEAGALYRSALEAGKLTVEEVLEAHTHLGTVAFSTGKFDQAKQHFLVAAMVDPNFLLPAEANRRANDFAGEQRKYARAVGKLDLSLRPPASASAGKPVRVEVRVRREALSTLKKIELSLEVGKRRLAQQILDAKSEVTMQVTVDAFPRSSQLQLIVRGLDDHESTLVTRTATLQLEASASSDGPSAQSPRPSTVSGRSFWATPWPYIIAGTLLVSGGVTLIVMTHHPDVDTLPVQINGAAVKAGAARSFGGRF
jgi:tetratricopeptide (TPR) repeat protein